MAKHWLAIIDDSAFIVARIAVEKNKEMKMLFLAQYQGKMPKATDAEEIFKQELGELRNWLVRLNIPLKRLKIAMSSLGLISKVIDLPQMANHELDKLMTNNIDQYFTIDMSNYLIDYRILNKYTENEKIMIKVLLAAFPTERMKYVLRICQKLGFKPVVVDLTADCIARIYGHLSNSMINGARSSEEGSENGDMAIVSLYSDKVEFILLKDGLFFLYSDMEVDIRNLIERYEMRLAKRREAEKRAAIFQVGESAYIVKTEKHIPLDSPFKRQDTDLSISMNELPKDEAVVLDEEVVLYQHTEEHIEDLYMYESSENTIKITAGATDTELYRDIDLNMEMDSKIEIGSRTDIGKQDYEQYKDLDSLIGVEDTQVNLTVNIYDEDIVNKDEEASHEQIEEVFKQTALTIASHQDEQEFLLEDLFVPLEKLEGNMAITQLDRNYENFLQTNEHNSDNTAKETDRNMKESAFSYDFKNNHIFDTLDINTTLIGIEELGDTGQDIDPKEQLENGLRPVLTNLSELLNSFAATNSGVPVSTIYLSGEHSIHPYLAECFYENLGIKTVAGFPNSWQPRFVKGAKDITQDWQHASLYGLALREE